MAGESGAPAALAEARAAMEGLEWQRAFDLAAGARADDPRHEAERLELVAWAAWWLGRMEECVAAREAAYRIFEELGDGRGAGRCAVWLYENNTMLGRPAVGSAWLQRARRALGDDEGCAEHAALLLREVEVAHGGGRRGDALTLARRALDLARALRSADLEGEALQAIGRVLIDDGRIELGLAHLDEAMLLAVEGRLGPYSTGKVYCSLVSACEDLGDLRRAAEWTDATSRWANTHPLAVFPGLCRIHRAVVLDLQGELVDAEREADRACGELLPRHVPNAAAAFAEVGDIRRRLGDLERADLAFARAEELSGRPCAGRALLRLAQGRVAEAVQIIAGCVAYAPPNPLARARLLPAAVHVAVAAGDIGTAVARSAELDAIASAYETPMLHALAAQSRGRVQLARCDPAAAEALCEALRLWTELSVPYEVATTHTLLAQALRECGDEVAAQLAFREARQLFARIGARLEPVQARELRLPAGLSEREAEVLVLVAGGLSNKDIAAELGLSAKTVSRHLSNIFLKIDVSSRAAATAFAFEHGLAGGPP